MSKELIVAGAIVMVCLGVTALALKKPSKPAPSPATGGELARNDSMTPSERDRSTPPSALNPTDSFGRDNLQGPPGTADLNPNRPFDNLGPSLPPPVVPQAKPFHGISALPGSSHPSTPLDTIPNPPPTEPASAEPSPAGSASERVHVIKRGDTYGEISKQYYGTSAHWPQIKAANPKLDPNGLQEGEKLIIPALPPGEAATPPAPSADGAAYVVKKNDTYYKIAKHELGDASRAREIEKLNQVSAADLRPGMKLALPARGARETGPVEAPGPTPAAGEGRIHVVGKDEYLTDIAKTYYGSSKHWRVIEKANPGIDPDRLKVGQKLVIPPLPGGAPGPLPSASATPATASEGEYVVVANDTFEVIAGKVLGDKKLHQKIAEANPGVDSSHLRIGQKLKLPAGAHGGSTAPVPAIAPLDPPPLAPPAHPDLHPVPLPGPAIPEPTAPGANSTPDPWNLNGPAATGPGAGTSTSAPTNPWSDLGDTTSPSPLRPTHGVK